MVESTVEQQNLHKQSNPTRTSTRSTSSFSSEEIANGSMAPALKGTDNANDASTGDSGFLSPGVSSTGQSIFFPAVTYDYYLHNDPNTGLCMMANRNIKKGSLIFSDSLEFLFSDVQEGDTLLFSNHKGASKKSGTKIPDKMAVTRDMLLRTHGVPAIDGDVIQFHLETPCMLMNHSCSPTVIDDSHDKAKGEGIATRNIRKGEQLTYQYCYQYYNHGPFFDPCLCGAKNCRGKLMGFVDLSASDQAALLPKASSAVQAMHDASKTLKHVETPTLKRVATTACNDTCTIVPRLVFPGPSCALAGIEIKQSDTGGYGLYALKDFDFGDRVYEYWRQDWPFSTGKKSTAVPQVVNMVASYKLRPGDLPEGTVMRVDPFVHAKRDRYGRYQFSGFDLLTAHSCEPNLCYTDVIEDEFDEWQGAYATRKIVAGEQLTVDFNSILWDRTSTDPDRSVGSDCHCGASTCVGTQLGFKHLSKSEQTERKNMTWRRVGPPYHGEDDKATKNLGKALTPYVRVQWREFEDDCCETASDSSSSSSDSSFGSDDDE